jgi:D-methionine transport system permease protein
MPETTSLLDTLNLLPEILKATGETLLMMAICLSAAIVIGGALGLLVFLTSRGQSLARFRSFNLVANGVINVVRSFPFIILLVAISPFTRVIAGTSIGPLAASVPLSIAAIFYFARLIEQTLRDVPRGVIEAPRPWAPRRCRSSAMCCWWRPAPAWCWRSRCSR